VGAVGARGPTGLDTMPPKTVALRNISQRERERAKRLVAALLAAALRFPGRLHDKGYTPALNLQQRPKNQPCRWPYEAPEPTVSAHQRMDPVGIVFGPVSVTGWNGSVEGSLTHATHCNTEPAIGAGAESATSGAALLPSEGGSPALLPSPPSSSPSQHRLTSSTIQQFFPGGPPETPACIG
jgi:hypothetical protein